MSEELKNKPEVKEEKIGKIASLIALLKSGAYTIEELIEKSGASKATVALQLKYGLPKKGLKVKIETAGDKLTYTLKNGKSS